LGEGLSISVISMPYLSAGESLLSIMQAHQNSLEPMISLIRGLLKRLRHIKLTEPVIKLHSDKGKSPILNPRTISVLIFSYLPLTAMVYCK
jgi:hypothetical protein